MPPRILYCNCTYAQAVPKETKASTLAHLAESGVAFEAVADLCEMAARRDPALQRLAAGGPLRVVACFPRAVKWLFAATGAPLTPETTEVLNMRTLDAAQVREGLFRDDVQPNLPPGKETAAPENPAS